MKLKVSIDLKILLAGISTGFQTVVTMVESLWNESPRLSFSDQLFIDEIIRKVWTD
jgi:hypothetical protein